MLGVLNRLVGHVDAHVVVWHDAIDERAISFGRLGLLGHRRGRSERLDRRDPGANQGGKSSNSQGRMTEFHGDSPLY
ncbi:hypothetical protein D3C72_2384940 [compost metagenome]